MKRILAFLLVLAMVFSLAACSSDDKDKKEDTPATTDAPTEEAKPTEETAKPTEAATVTDEPVATDEPATTDDGTIELSLWDIAVEGDGNRPAYDAAMEDLKATFPNIKIVETVTENEAYKTKIKAAVGANELPDIFFTWAGAFLGDFVDAGKVHCLDDVLQSYVDSGEITVAQLGNSTYGGKHYGVPTTYNIVTLFANMDILAEVGYDHIPATLDELTDCCDKLVAAGKIPFGCAGKETWCVTEYLEPIIEKTIGATALKGIMTFGETWNNAGVASSVDLLQEMITKGYFDPDGIALGNEEVKANFMNGKYAFYQNGSWNCGDFANKEKVTFNVKAGEFPVVDSANGQLGMLIGGPSDTIAVSEGPNAEIAAQYAVEFGRLICHYGYLFGSGLPAWKVWGDTSAVLPIVQEVSAICANAVDYVLFGDNAMSAEKANTYLDYVAMVYGQEIDGEGFVAGLVDELG